MECREKCVPISIFTLLLDSSCHNTFDILKQIDKTSGVDFKEMKHRISDHLVSGYLDSKLCNKSKLDDNVEVEYIHEVNGIGTILLGHMILENFEKNSTQCHLCKIMTDGKSEKHPFIVVCNDTESFMLTFHLVSLP